MLHNQLFIIDQQMYHQLFMIMYRRYLNSNLLDMNYMTGCISGEDELYSNTYGVQLEKQQFAYFFQFYFLI